ncbi:MAG: hypothetical protein R3E54_02395 [Halioglobus sp.]
MAYEMGVDRFRVIPPGIPFAAKEPEKLKDDWFLKDDEGRVEAFKGDVPTSCFYLYRSITTNPDGGTAPCCIVYGDKTILGISKPKNWIISGITRSTSRQDRYSGKVAEESNPQFVMVAIFSSSTVDRPRYPTNFRLRRSGRIMLHYLGNNVHYHRNSFCMRRGGVAAL